MIYGYMVVSYKKRVRLKDSNYEGCYRYFITLCTHNKKPIFNNDPFIVEWLTDVLREKSITFGFKVWAYCFMPDHLHLLIEGKESNSDIKKFVSSYKQLTGFSYKRKTGLPLWQLNFYEHVLRREEETMNITRYIFGNPVRKVLVSDFRQYRFLGSFELDVTKL